MLQILRHSLRLQVNQNGLKAIKNELDAIQRNSTKSLTQLPEKKSSIRLKWIYQTKYHSDGHVLKRKARLVVKWYTQKQGIDFNEMFTLVVRMKTVCIFLAAVAQRRWSVYQLDVKSAFLKGELKKDVYASQPEGFIITGKENFVYNLNKALYGLRQAPYA